MIPPARQLGRAVLPWLVSATALVYVFGYAVDLRAIPAASANANMPAFLLLTVIDKLLFFAFWTLVQHRVIGDFIEAVPIRRVLAIKGAAELMRSVNNGLSDAAFLFGTSRLVKVALPTVLAVSSIPFLAHVAVLFLQACIALPFLPGELAQNRDVLIAIATSGLVVGGIVAGLHFGPLRRMLRSAGVAPWIENIPLRRLLPYVGWFAVFSACDVLIQGLASRLFGVEIPWISLAARVPILYFAISLPSLGNFGTREIAWAALFQDYGTREELIAFALWTNVVFMTMHVLIGVLFVGRALALLREMRVARDEGETIPRPLLHDSIDP